MVVVKKCCLRDCIRVEAQMEGRLLKAEIWNKFLARSCWSADANLIYIIKHKLLLLKRGAFVKPPLRAKQAVEIISLNP